MIDNIIAVDFVGTLCKNRYPDIGEPIQEVIDKLLEEQKNGAKLILWTCRCDKELTDAVEWCGRHGIVFDAVNDHLPEMKEAFGNNTRKIFAHQYWDDRAVDILKELFLDLELSPDQIEDALFDKVECCEKCFYCDKNDVTTNDCCVQQKKETILNYIIRLEAEKEKLIGKLELEKGKAKKLKEELKTVAVDQKVIKSFTIKEFVEKVIFEIVNKPSEFAAEQGTANFLSGSSHRQNEIIDIIEKMAVNCDDNNI